MQRISSLSCPGYCVCLHMPIVPYLLCYSNNYNTCATRILAYNQLLPFVLQVSKSVFVTRIDIDRNVPARQVSKCNQSMAVAGFYLALQFYSRHQYLKLRMQHRIRYYPKYEWWQRLSQSSNLTIRKLTSKAIIYFQGLCQTLTPNSHIILQVSKPII